MGTRKNSRPPGSKTGPAPFVPDQEMIDTARYLIGRRQYPSRVVVHIRQKYKLSQDMANRVIDYAREQAIADLAGQGCDPMTGMFLFLQSVVSDGTQPMRDRLAAAGNVIRMLGLDRLLKKMDSGSVDAYLARLAGAQANNAIPLPAGESPK